MILFFLFLGVTVFLVLYAIRTIFRRDYIQRQVMEDGIADDEFVVVDYRGEVIPMRYIEYLEYWSAMSRTEKRQMAMRLKKKVEKGHVDKGELGREGHFCHVFYE